MSERYVDVQFEFLSADSDLDSQTAKWCWKWSGLVIALLDSR